MTNKFKKKLKNRFVSSALKLTSKEKEKNIEFWFEYIWGNYTSIDKHYHDIFHIIDCLNELDIVSKKIDNPVFVELAIWFHDVIYDTHSKTNEEDSEKKWREFAEEMEINEIEPISTLILTTKHGVFLPVNEDCNYIADIDLAGFGKDVFTVQRANMNIRKEYDWMGEKEYKSNRIFILNKFLKRAMAGQLYYTKYFNEKYGEAALKSLKNSVEELTDQLDWKEWAAKEFIEVLLTVESLDEKTIGEWEKILFDIIDKNYNNRKD